MSKVFLIVEDDHQIRNFIKFSLQSQEYECIEASTGKEAIGMIAINKIDAIVLDLGLPDMGGVEIIRQVRSFSNLPIIVVSAHDQDNDKVEALDAGADDYLTKPFSVKELLARIRVLFRREGVPTNETTLYKVGDLEIDTLRHKVLLEGVEIHFTPMEFDVLILMVRNAGKVLTHKYILKEVWGSEFESDLQSVRVFMANIRRKLEKNPAKPRYNMTEIGVGYRFSDD